MTRDQAIIFCAPQSQYRKPPKDYSNSELIDCPVCKQKMWLSEKKKAVMELIQDKDIVLYCYHCFKRDVINNPDYFEGHIKVHL